MPDKTPNAQTDWEQQENRHQYIINDLTDVPASHSQTSQPQNQIINDLDAHAAPKEQPPASQEMEHTEEHAKSQPWIINDLAAAATEANPPLMTNAPKRVTANSIKNSDETEESPPPQSADSSQEPDAEHAKPVTNVATGYKYAATDTAEFDPTNRFITDQMTDDLDLWWGSYSGRGMVPSWALSAILAVGVVWIAAVFFHDFLIQVVIGVLGTVALLQGTRWLYRVFGYNYRLTTRRLYVDRGWLYSASERVDLKDIKSVDVTANWWNEQLNVGEITIVRQGKDATPIILEAVRDPQRIAKQIRNSVDLASQTN